VLPVAELPVAPVGDAFDGVELQVSLQKSGNDRPQQHVNEDEDGESGNGVSFDRLQNAVGSVNRPCRGRNGIHPCDSSPLNPARTDLAPQRPYKTAFGV
jgi:hypothetical protein